MSRKEIIGKVIFDAKELHNEVIEKINNIKSGHIHLHTDLFIEIIFKIIRYKWSIQHPDIFVICYATGEDYTKCPSAPYKWYIKSINGKIDRFMEINHLSDYYIYESDNHDANRDRIQQQRFNVINELLNSDEDILLWCFKNVDLD